MRRVETRRNDSGRGGMAELLGELDAQIQPVVAELDAQIRPVLDEFGGTLPLFEVLDDAELRGWVRGFRAGKASAAGRGG